MSRETVACVTTQPAFVEGLEQLLLGADAEPLDQADHELLPVAFAEWTLAFHGVSIPVRV